MRIFILLLLSFATNVVRAQDNYAFKHLNVENGLSQSSVLSITQDAKGFIWMGTRFGLNKYDSQTFKIYKQEPNNPKSLSGSEYIAAMLPAKDGSLWIGTPHGLNRYNEARDNFDRVLADKSNPTAISNSLIHCIFQDSKKRIWVGTGNGLNLLTDQENYRFRQYLSHPKSGQRIYTVAEDHTGTIWISSSGGLMNMRIVNGKAQFKYFKNFSDAINKAIDNHVTSIVEDSDHNLWIGTKQTGLYQWNLRTAKITAYTYSSLNTNGISSNNIRKIIIDQQNRLWIGTLHGINIYNPKNHTFSSIQNEPGNPASLSQNSVYDIFQDRQGIIWIGTYYGGVNLLYPNYTPFKVYQSAKGQTGLSSNVVSAITEDNDHNLWIGTEGEGLNYYDRKRNIYTHYRYNPNNSTSLSSNLVKSIIKDNKNRIWVGTHLGGLNLFQPASHTFVRYTSKKNDVSSISNDEITAIFEDSKGRFWVGTNNGLNSFNTSTGKFVRNMINGLSDAVSYIFEDSKHNLWVAANSGLYQLKGDASRFTPRRADRPNLLPYNNVSSIAEDKKGNLWIGTFRNGLFKLDAEKHHYTLVDKKAGLPSNNIVGILEDEQQILWVSTDNGLCRFDPAKRTFKTYNVKDGLPGNEFNYKSLLKDASGELFFGSLSGMISFFPSQIRENKSAAKVIFTGLKLFNKPVQIDEENSVLDKNLSVAPELTLKSAQNVFTIDFTVLNFIKSDKNKYAYKLVGFENNWNYVDVPAASYTNISPGNYKLLVKGSNNDGLWAKEASVLKLEILPPFYRTWWAYLFYLLVTVAVLVLVLRYLLVKALLTQEKEVNEHKLEFFTNISHEIKTPLTLITGPLDKMISDAQDDPALHRSLQPIKNNADRLMHLVNELLDFRKTESGKMPLQVSPGNLVKFCREIYLAFQNVAITKHIEYSFYTEVEDITIYFDKVQLEKVMFNLLSNAFKFTPDAGEIKVALKTEENHIKVLVSNTGMGIPLEDQGNLFNSFYQSKSHTSIGTGLGLSLSKSIINLHHGNISFTSKPATVEATGFTCFTFQLKQGKDHFDAKDFIQDYVYYDDASNYSLKPALQPETPVITEQTSTETKKRYQILLVEDNAEVRHFVKNALIDEYEIQEAEDGVKGLDVAIELIPDLILSDVMMPNMDGLELCRRLKTDERTSHIPVVLLTARSAYVHQINGLEQGADAYIMKPFNLQVLKLNIQNLLQARETLKQKFSQVVTLEPKNLIINQTDQKFLNKIIQIIEDRISDTEFDVPTLATEIGMSQPVLYKKIRALTDLSVNDFIKSIRLKRAAQLLGTTRNIAEVAYSVGFNDRKYFSLEFKKYFGKSPTEYIQQ
ncbi:two-component regulator propeller domain-containing protein [Pedobacter sp.]|uniref:hybrid sensor histidine kinase/response regulator n=1 Tax=Pedobacter sp. TaxID=1411316 RepID=UPI003BAADBEB